MILLALAGCDTPTVGFSYDDQRDIRVGDNQFRVYFNKSEAQAIRLNRQALSGLKQARLDGQEAIEQVTGCLVKRVHPKSDPVLTRAELRCPKTG